MVGQTGRCLILDYAENHTLAHFLPKVGIPEALVRIWCLQALSSVAYIHSFGFAHGNLSVEDFVMSKELDLKIIDFGSATDGHEPGSGPIINDL